MSNLLKKWPWGKYRGRLIIGAPSGYLKFCVNESKTNPKTLFKGELLEAIKEALAIRYY